MKKVKVNESACIGCGACVAIDPEHFDFNDSGLSHAISNENLESASLVNAVESCPTNAIVLEDGCECCTDCNCGDDCECNEDNKCSSKCTCGNNCECCE